MKLWTTMAVVTAGGAVAYFVASEDGRRRGSALLDTVSTPVRTITSLVGGDRGPTDQLEYEGPSGPDPIPEGTPDDVTLTNRVESELFRYPDVPKGRLNVQVEDGVLVLRGQLDSRQQIDDVVTMAASIDGVRGVQNLLHLPGTPAPNKAEARDAGNAGASGATITRR